MQMYHRMSSTNTPAAKTANSSEPTIFKKFLQDWGGVGFFTLVAMTMYAFTFWNFIDFQGGADRWINLKPQLAKIGIYTVIATIALTVAALMYFIQDPQKAIYFILVMTCAAVSMSYSALAIAAISR